MHGRVPYLQRIDRLRNIMHTHDSSALRYRSQCRADTTGGALLDRTPGDGADH